jgi:hypothetical protein
MTHPSNLMKTKTVPSLFALACRIVLLFACMCGTLSATIYYVDSAGGSDANNGTSTSTPWQTLAKVNATTFAAGDQILFKAGSSWTGTTKLNPKGSGTAGNPIKIDLYGTGAKPIINAGTATGNGAVYLSNQQYWEISNLEIINNSTSDGDRRGVHILNSAAGTTLNHIYIKNCYIHDIRGKAGTSDGDISAKRTGGIVVESTSTTAKYNDILIEGNTIANVRNQGIVACINGNGSSTLNNYYPGTTAWNNLKCTSVVVRGNVISEVYKNGMIIRNTDETGLVEENVLYNTANATTGNTIFTSSARGTVFQYNEGYNNLAGSVRDGSLYDADLRSFNIVFQYSYSHDNSHGLFWQYPNTDGPNSGVVCRYNISQNDKGIIFAFSGDAGASATSYLYNNTIYIPNTATSQLIFDYRSATHTIYAYNNIFYILNTGATYDFSSMTKTFDYNVFYGVHPSGEPSDAHKLTSNPLLVSVGSGGNGISTVYGYMLQAGSPCIDSGMTVAGNGGLDYWGNPVPYNGVTDRGANEYSPSGTDTTPPTPSPMTWATAPYAAGDNAISMVATTATDTSGVEYFFANTTITGHDSGWQAGTSYTDSGLSSGTTYTYTVTARDQSPNYNQTVSSAPASATTPTCTAPAITVNPANATACAGSTAAFSVTATGTNPTYQWQFSTDGGASFSAISGANSSSYTTPATVTGDNGKRYRCVVSGTCGTATSTSALLTVNSRPTSFVSGNTAICSGGSATIQAALTGTAPWNVTWSDGNVQSGVAASPATRSVSPTSTTTYTVTALTDAGCTAQSGDRTGSAVVTVNAAPGITTQPQSQTVAQGANVTFSVTATGTAPLAYQWRKNGVNISGATSSSHTLTAVTTNDAGGYSVVVSNTCGSVTSTTATLTVTTGSAGVIVISEVYAGGGKSGATYQNDFVVLKNKGGSSVSLNGWSLQHDKAGVWQTPFALPNVSIAPGKYFLVKCYNDGGTASGAALPTPDATATQSSVWNLSTTAGAAVALVNSTTKLTSCAGTSIVDLVGINSTTSNCYEGAGVAPAGSATQSDQRASSGCQDTNNNASDFALGTPTPENSATAAALCP